MTIQPTSSHDTYVSQQSASHKPPAQPKSEEQPQDTVQLSSKAKGAGDVDHDGDSH